MILFEIWFFFRVSWLEVDFQGYICPSLSNDALPSAYFYQKTMNLVDG